MTDKHIVAIDLGTSKIALTVAKVNGKDVQIVYYKETPSAGIRYSGVFNASQAKGPLTEAVRQAEESLGIKITQAVVGKRQNIFCCTHRFCIFGWFRFYLRLRNL